MIRKELIHTVVFIFWQLISVLMGNHEFPLRDPFIVTITRGLAESVRFSALLGIDIVAL